LANSRADSLRRTNQRFLRTFATDEIFERRPEGNDGIDAPVMSSNQLTEKLIEPS